MCLSIAEIYRTVTYCRDIALSKCEANNSGTLNISLVELRRYYSRGVGTSTDRLSDVASAAAMIVYGLHFAWFLSCGFVASAFRIPTTPRRGHSGC